MNTGMRVRLWLVAVAGVLTLAGCQAFPASSHGFSEVSDGFVRHPDAIEIPPPPRPGMDQTPRYLELVPVGDCVFGVDNSGIALTPTQQVQVSTNWVGAPGCVRLQLSPRPEPTGDRLHSGALRVFSAVPAGNGAVLGIGRYPLLSTADGVILAEAPALFRREPDGSVRELARPPIRGFGGPPDPARSGFQPRTEAYGLIFMGHRLFVAGADIVDGRVTPVVWVSEDGGETLTELPLPPAPGDRPLTDQDQYQTPVPMRIATDGHTLLATDTDTDTDSDEDGWLWTWRSADGGRTWQVSAAPPLPGSANRSSGRVEGVVTSHGRWLLVGGTESGPGMLSSPDGAQWTVEDTSGMGMGSVTDVTVDHRGDLVVLGEFRGAGHGGGKGARSEVCGVVWSGRLGALRRQELGCTGPAAKFAEFTSIATIADGRVLIANGSDLWIRD